MSVLVRGIAAALSLASVTTVVVPDDAAASPFLLFDPVSDQVIDYEDADRYWHPASLTKMMTAYLTFEAVKTGKLTWGGKLELSPYARSQPATRVGLKPGIDVTIDQAVRALILRSANDFAVALAENIAGSEPAFVDQMNAAAKRLGMTRTHFANPHGLPEPSQITTARDMAHLAAAIYHDFPEHADVFSNPQVGIGRAKLTTLNSLLRTFNGADGMKTGFTCSSGYNIVGSATRNGHRLIAVVLGETTGDARNKRVAELLEAGFARDSTKAAGPATVQLATLPLPPMEPLPVEDLTHETKTWKCGNASGPARPRAVKVAAKGPGRRKHR